MSCSSPYGSRLFHTKGSLRDSLHKRAETTLSKEGISNAVVCPEDVDKNEWIAVHTMDFYNDICMLYSIVHEECTVERCSTMSAGDNYYRWKDNNHYRVPALLPARIYIDYLLNWLASQFENETLFPVTEGVPFPADYIPQVQTMFRRMFRVYAHIWYNHMDMIRLSDCETSFRFSFTHYLYFVNHYCLVTPDVLFPLATFINELCPTLPLVTEMNKAQQIKIMRRPQPLTYQRLTSNQVTISASNRLEQHQAIPVKRNESIPSMYYSNNYLPNTITSKNQNYPFEGAQVTTPTVTHNSVPPSSTENQMPEESQEPELEPELEPETDLVVEDNKEDKSCSIM